MGITVSFRSCRYYDSLGSAESLKQETYDVVRTLMDDFPNQSDPMGLMGSVAHQFGDTDGAVSWWQRVLDRNPNRVDAYIGMGRVHFEEGAFEKAVEMYRKALAVRQTPPTGHYHLGEALLELGRPEEAVSALKAETREVLIANELKSKYLTLLSHELRGPLNGIIGISEFMTDNC